MTNAFTEIINFRDIHKNQINNDYAPSSPSMEEYTIEQS